MEPAVGLTITAVAGLGVGVGNGLGVTDGVGVGVGVGFFFFLANAELFGEQITRSATKTMLPSRLRFLFELFVRAPAKSWQ